MYRTNTGILNAARCIAHQSLGQSRLTRVRWTSTASAASVHGSHQEPRLENENTRSALLYIDSVFPLRLAIWDIRYHLGAFLREDLLEGIDDIFRDVKMHKLHTVSYDPQEKHGGVFVEVKYDPEGLAEIDALSNLVAALKNNAKKRGGMPSWVSLRSGNLWVVQGRPWREDLYRYPSPLVKVAFDGPDLREEYLFDLFRRYGQIVDISSPQPGPSGNLRYSIVSFRSLRSATIAHNCMHGLSASDPSGSNPDKKTILRTSYEKPIQAHVIRDWISGHPRIVIPIVVFLLGTLTYAIFDPIRTYSVQSKLLDRFDYTKSKVYRWIKANTLDHLSFSSRSRSEEPSTLHTNIWKERIAAEDDLRTYMSDMPNTVTFIHGPQGSGKSRMIKAALEGNTRPVLTIDCADLYRARSDSQLVTSLAHQTGYWPTFPFVNSLNNILDMATMGLIGQKAGLSTSVDNQIKEMLEVIGTGLKSVKEARKKEMDWQSQTSADDDLRHVEEQEKLQEIMRGAWHDGRIDCIAGNGIMSELGYGDEPLLPQDWDAPPVTSEQVAQGSNGDEPKSLQKVTANKAINALPIVIIKNFAGRRGKDEVMGVLTQWAATLVENQIAHVLVVSDNRENEKLLAHALPSKPLNLIALSDADPANALNFVTERLRAAGVEEELTPESIQHIERLGGRMSDLESLIHKVRSGQEVEKAIEDIISRGVSELRKNAFGDDLEDEKALPWKREQVWAIMKRLTKDAEIPYQDVLIDYPFKGDETALRNMEHNELITIIAPNGLPTAIRAGRPVYRYVFERLVNDPIFHATNEISFNEKQVAGAETTIKACEDELLKLREIGSTGDEWYKIGSNAISARQDYLLKKLKAAQTKLAKLEAQNADLRKVLAKKPGSSN